jgi:hypothetical protein
MPEELWQEAVHVARSAGLYATAKATRIKYEALKERCEPASLGVCFRQARVNGPEDGAIGASTAALRKATTAGDADEDMVGGQW